MGIIYKSVLKDEMASFIEFIRLSVVDWKGYQCALSELDSFLYMDRLEEKKLEADQLRRWIDGYKLKLETKKAKLSKIRRFSKYLSTLGIKSSLPELPCRPSSFTPYVYTADEMLRIISMADDFTSISTGSLAAAQLPMLLRILYGCGLRLGEAVALEWDDIDLAAGTVLVRQAKNRKQRMLPMGAELVRILRLYQASPFFSPKGQGYLFGREDGTLYSNGAYWRIFSILLCDLGIKNPQTLGDSRRGPCLHSIRHAFALQSLLKAESEGKDFMEAVPFLSTYLGHVGLMETDKYLNARHELYTRSHATMEDYTDGVFPEVF